MHFVFSIYACSLVSCFFRSHLFYLLNLLPISIDLCISLFSQSNLSYQRPDSITDVTDTESHAKLSLFLKNPYQQVQKYYWILKINSLKALYESGNYAAVKANMSCFQNL